MALRRHAAGARAGRPRGPRGPAGGQGRALARAQPLRHGDRDRQTPAEGTRSVSREPVTLTVDADYGDRAGLEKKLRAATKRYAGRQAAIVLTFGKHPDPGGGQAYARRVNSTLTKARPDMFEKTTRRDFWKGGAAGHASVEIYFYTY